MNDVEDFLLEKNLHPRNRNSKLDAFKDEIFQLKDMGFSEKVICEFLLEKKNVSVARQTLNQFIRSRRKLENKTVEHATELSKNRLSNRSQSNAKSVQKINTGFQKFNSREEIDLDDLV